MRYSIFLNDVNLGKKHLNYLIVEKKHDITDILIH